MITSPISLCAGSFSLFRQRVDQILEHMAPLLKILEAVKGGAGRGEKNDIPLLGTFRRCPYGGGVVFYD